MRRPRRGLAAATVWCLAALLRIADGGVHAQSTCPAPPPYPLLRQDEDYSYLRDPSCAQDDWDFLKYRRLGPDDDAYLTLGGEARGWYEGFRNALWGVGAQDADGYFLQRLSMHGDVHAGRRLRFFAQLTSNLEVGRQGGPRPVIDESPLWLEQAFVDVTLVSGPEPHQGALVLRLGRQQFHFGTGRLVDNREGPNVRQAFDGIAVRWKSPSWDVRAFGTKPVLNGTGVFDAAPDPSMAFWGIYAVAPLPATTDSHIDLYYLGLDRDRAMYDAGVGPESRHTIGARWWGTHASWDYNTEAGVQFGTFARGALQAWGIVHDSGHTFVSAPFRPRIALTAAATSGDNGDPRATLGTFNPLFPTGSYFGQGTINLNGPSNMTELAAQITIQPTKSLTVVADSNIFWRTRLGDGVYDLAGNLLVSGIGAPERYVGHQASVGLYWQTDRHLSWSVAYGHFFAGPFLKNASPSRRSVDYGAGWVTYKF